jgi:hypothetical protein
VDPFGVEFSAESVVACGIGKDLSVSSPSHFFIALGTVGGDVEKVAALTPDDVLKQLVDQVVGTAETSCFRELGRDDASFDVFGAELSRPAGDLNVSESVKGDLKLVRVYNSMLTQEQVNQNYEHAKTL